MKMDLILYLLAILYSFAHSPIVTPPRNRGGVIFSLQFVCVCVCVCVCLCVYPTLLVNKIPAERMLRFGRNFTKSLLLALAQTLLNLVTLG